MNLFNLTRLTNPLSWIRRNFDLFVPEKKPASIASRVLHLVSFMPPLCTKNAYFDTCYPHRESTLEVAVFLKILKFDYQGKHFHPSIITYFFDCSMKLIYPFFLFISFFALLLFFQDPGAIITEPYGI